MSCQSHAKRFVALLFTLCIGSFLILSLIKITCFHQNEIIRAGSDIGRNVEKIRRSTRALEGIRHEVSQKNDSLYPFATDHRVAEEFQNITIKYGGIFVPLDIIQKYYSLMGPSALLGAIESTYSHCHSQGHNIGKVVYLRTGSLNASFDVCGKACLGGCFHGAIMQFFITLTHGMDFESATKTIRPYYSLSCSISATHTFVDGDCFHGIGHVIMVVLAQYHVKRAIAECKTLPTKIDQYSCATGAFMEYFDAKDFSLESVALAAAAESNDAVLHNSNSNATSGTSTIGDTRTVGSSSTVNRGNSSRSRGDDSRSKDNSSAASVLAGEFKMRLYPCSAIHDFPAACYHYFTKLIIHKYKPSEIVAACLALPQYGQRKGCFFGVGNAYGHYFSLSMQTVLPVGYLCSAGDRDDRRMCIYGAVGWKGPFRSNYTLLTVMCQSVKDASLRTACINGTDAQTTSIDSFYYTSEMEEAEMANKSWHKVSSVVGSYLGAYSRNSSNSSISNGSGKSSSSSNGSKKSSSSSSSSSSSTRSSSSSSSSTRSSNTSIANTAGKSSRSSRGFGSVEPRPRNVP